GASAMRTCSPKRRTRWSSICASFTTSRRWNSASRALALLYRYGQPQLLHDELQVLPCLALRFYLLGARTEQIRRVICRHHARLPAVEPPLTAHLGDPDRRLQESGDRRVAETDDHARANQCELLVQVGDARSDLFGLRSPVARGAAFEDVADVHVFFR